MSRPRAPLLLMSYLNPLLAFGFANLAAASERAGVCGFIVPDLPFDESEEFRAALAPHGLALIQMVTPVTKPERMARLCAATQGFVYAVTMTGTTGRTAAVPAEVTSYLDAVRGAAKLPVCAGFGIRSREQVEQLRGHVAGVIVGSALVEVMENGQDAAAIPEIAAPGRRLTLRLQHKLPGYAMLAVLIGGLSMVSPFSIDTFFPAFHAMERALHVDAWQLQQVITAYMVPFAFASLVHGPLSDAIGRRPVMIWGMALYTVGSIACTLAPNYMSLIAARALQGATAGVGVVIGRAVIRDLYEGARAQRLMSVTTMIFSIAPAVAPIVGGWAHVAFGWRAVFAFMVLCGLMFAFSAWWKLPETHAARGAHPVQCDATSSSTSLTVLRHPEFLMLASAAALNFNSIALFIGSAPAIVETHWGLGETSYWMLFLPVIGGILVGATIAGYMAGRLDLVFQVRIGFGITFTVALIRVLLHLAMTDLPIPLQQALLFTQCHRRAVRISRPDACACSTCFRRRAAPRLPRSLSWR